MTKMSDTVSLKEYFDALREADKDALKAALIAAEKRLDLLNELRQGVATTDQLNALEKVVSALARLVYIGLGAVLALQLVLQYIGSK